MNIRGIKMQAGSTLLRSVFLLVLGLSLIPLGMIFIPGLILGIFLMALAFYPWIRLFNHKKVKIMVQAVTDNYLNDMQVPVAILSATRDRDGFDFDPREVDPGSVRFGPHGARPAENMSDPRIYSRNMVDLNDDGIPDLMLYFDGDTAGIDTSVGEACLWAKMKKGGWVHGCNGIEYDNEKGLGDLVVYK